MLKATERSNQMRTDKWLALTSHFIGVEVAKAWLEPLGLLGEMINSRSEAGIVQHGAACCAKKQGTYQILKRKNTENNCDSQSWGTLCIKNFWNICNFWNIKNINLQEIKLLNIKTPNKKKRSLWPPLEIVRTPIHYYESW